MDQHSQNPTPEKHVPTEAEIARLERQVQTVERDLLVGLSFEEYLARRFYFQHPHLLAQWSGGVFSPALTSAVQSFQEPPCAMMAAASWR